MINHYSLEKDGLSCKPAELSEASRKLGWVHDYLNNEGVKLATLRDNSADWTGAAATACLGEVGTISTTMTTHAPKIEEAANAVTTFQRLLETTLATMPGLNSRWDQSETDYKNNRDKAVSACDDEIKSYRGLPDEFSVLARKAAMAGQDRAIDTAWAAVSGTQMQLDSEFNEMVDSLKAAATACGAALVAAMPIAFTSDDWAAVKGGKISEGMLAGLRSQVFDKNSFIHAADILSGRSPFPTDPKAVHDAWLELSAAQQAGLLKGDPARFGNLNGIPAKDRDTANKITLNNQVDRVTAALKDSKIDPTMDPEDLQALQAKTDLESEKKISDFKEKSGMSMAEAEHALGVYAQLQDNGEIKADSAHLLAYEPRAYGCKGRAAIAYGDVDSADNVAVAVPGLNSDLTNIGNVSGDARNLFTAAHEADPSKQTAVIAWQGYDTPNFGDVADQDKAEAGAKLLAADVNALRVTHDGPIKGKLTVVGHSYGSTTTGLALQHTDMQVDQVALIGSPGVGGWNSKTVDDLGLDKSKVFVGSNSCDPVTLNTHLLGTDPVQAEFGATRFKAEDPDFHWNPTADHSLYYRPGSESLYNLSSIVTGHGDLLDKENMVVGGRASNLGSPKDDELTRVATGGHTHTKDVRPLAVPSAVPRGPDPLPEVRVLGPASADPPEKSPRPSSPAENPGDWDPRMNSQF